MMEGLELEPILYMTPQKKLVQQWILMEELL